MTGTVYKSTGSWYVLKDGAGKVYQARMKGIFKIDEITSTNPVAVGDIVEFEVEKEITSTGNRLHTGCIIILSRQMLISLF
jgi:ribosome biogenesis GTPase / thiamine phosphate phosphatase